MLKQEYIEKAVRDIQKEAEKLGLHITEVLVENPKVIAELEKMRVGIFRIRFKPAFVSTKNYKRLRLKENEYGHLYGIRFISKKNGE